VRPLRQIAAVALLVVVVASAGDAQASLPVVHLDTGERTLRETRKTTAEMRIAGRSGYRGRIGIELRGSSSRFRAKRSFALETRARDGDARNVRLLGLPAENDWILHAVASDPTLMRDVVAYDAARWLGRYAPRSRFVELRLNRRYHGVYVLLERPKLDARRVAVERSGITGGYLIELTRDVRPRQEDEAFRLPVTNRPALFADPRKGDLDRREERYIAGFAGRAERALYGQGGDWRALIDEASAVDFAIVQELFRNDEAFLRSVYLHKATNAPLAFGPVWDFDRSSANPIATPHMGPEGWASPGHPWGERLFADAGFAARFGDRWRQLRAAGIAERVLGSIAGATRELAGAHERNAARWPDDQARGFAGEVAALEDWIAARVAWIDANVDRLRP
jgi:hypothetical protein